jgi:hypothetical protein
MMSLTLEICMVSNSIPRLRRGSASGERPRVSVRLPLSGRSLDRRAARSEDISHGSPDPVPDRIPIRSVGRRLGLRAQVRRTGPSGPGTGPHSVDCHLREYVAAPAKTGKASLFILYKLRSLKLQRNIWTGLPDLDQTPVTHTATPTGRGPAGPRVRLGAGQALTKHVRRSERQNQARPPSLYQRRRVGRSACAKCSDLLRRRQSLAGLVRSSWWRVLPADYVDPSAGPLLGVSDGSTRTLRSTIPATSRSPLPGRRRVFPHGP